MSVWARSLFALLALALLFQGRAIYYLVYALLGVYLTQRIAVRRALGRIEVTRVEPALRLFPGERTGVALTIKSKSRFPLPWVRLCDQSDQALAVVSGQDFAFALPPRGEVRLSYEIEATRRGRYTVGPVSIEAGDPFGIERFSVLGTERTDILVYPRVHSIESLGIRTQMQSGSFRARNRWLADSSRVAGVRDYVAGDSIRHVHWRATAHTGDFKVKNFEPMGTLDLAVVLDLAYHHFAQWNVTAMSELSVEVAASVLALASERNQAFGLYGLCEHASSKTGAPFLSTGVRKGQDHLVTCLETLALVQLTDRPSAVDGVIEEIALRLRRETTVIWIAPRADEETVRPLVTLKGLGFGAMLVHAASDAAIAAVPPGVAYARVSYVGDVSSLANSYQSA